MTQDPSTPGLFTAEIRLMLDIADFQIVRDKDWSQVFCPNPYSDGDDILGPDTVIQGQTWCIDGKAGDRYLIRFQRNYEDGKEHRKVSWEKTGYDALSITERWLATSKRQSP
eukprot:UN3127